MRVEALLPVEEELVAERVALPVALEEPLALALELPLPELLSPVPAAPKTPPWTVGGDSVLAPAAAALYASRVRLLDLRRH